MHIAVVGASGATGRLVVTAALEAGHQVSAIVRNPPIFNAPFGAEVVEAAVVSDGQLVLPDGVDAVISTLGKRSVRDPEPTCAAGIHNVISAMRRQGVSRLVVTSAAPVLTTGIGEPWWYRYGLRPFVRAMGPYVYRDLEAMERQVRMAEDFCHSTILRPGYLRDDISTNYRLRPGSNATTSASRADLADALGSLVGVTSTYGKSFGLERGDSRREPARESGPIRMSI